MWPLYNFIRVGQCIGLDWRKSINHSYYFKFDYTVNQIHLVFFSSSNPIPPKFTIIISTILLHVILHIGNWMIKLLFCAAGILFSSITKHIEMCWFLSMHYRNSDRSLLCHETPAWNALISVILTFSSHHFEIY